MAESFVNVTEGSGKKLHTYQRTIGANAVEDEVVLLGHQYLATYTVTTGLTSTATAASHLLQIMAGASLNVYVTRIQVMQVLGCTTAAFARLGLYRLTTAGTGGTARTARPLDGTDAAAGASAMTLPTVKGTEGDELWLHSAMWIQTVPTGGPASGAMAADLDLDRLRTKAIRIPAGAANGLAVKMIDALAGAQVLVMATLIEANF